MFFNSNKDENELISKKNKREFFLEDVVGFFMANIHHLRTLEENKVLPLTRGIGISHIANDLIKGYKSDRIFDLDEIPFENEREIN